MDSSYRSLTRDGSGAHTYSLTLNPSFTKIAMCVWAIRPNGSDTSTTWDLGQFRQTNWSAASGENHGDVPFGSATEPDPVGSFEGNIDDASFHNCTHAGSVSDRLYTVTQTSELRLDWQEWGSQAEDRFPGWDGDVYLNRTSTTRCLPSNATLTTRRAPPIPT
ncbi:MAG: hypothetical protein ACJAZO_001838 [Myxococcota bacterium]|jgi:hypothetical protein